MCLQALTLVYVVLHRRARWRCPLPTRRHCCVLSAKQIEMAMDGCVASLLKKEA